VGAPEKGEPDIVVPDVAPVVAAAAVPAVTRRRGRVLLPALVVGLLGLAGVATWQGLDVRHQHRLTSARQQAGAVATTYAVDLTTYDYSHLDAQFAKVLSNSTGSFRSEYTAASASLRDLIAKFKATASGKVLDTAVINSDTGHAQVLLFVDQTVTNSNSTTPRIDRSRMRMGLEKHGDRWLISSLDLL
jgi:Mce-associated membrane protein